MENNIAGLSGLSERGESGMEPRGPCRRRKTGAGYDSVFHEIVPTVIIESYAGDWVAIGVPRRATKRIVERGPFP